ncbi:MAG: glycosyltransferase 87 family protein [Actinomycetota bacterium]|nr:glycosyltransferase 87 family protein [Actinomycetota bacterium]
MGTLKRMRSVPSALALVGARTGCLRRSASEIYWPRAAALGALATVLALELALAVFLVRHPSQMAMPNAPLLFQGRFGGSPFAVSQATLPRDPVFVRQALFGLLVAMSVGYLAVLVLARHIRVRWGLAALLVAVMIVGLAPILLSKDAFLYLSYARLGAVHHLNPYVHPPAAAPHDTILRYIDWHRQVSPYGPLFTLATYPLALVSIPAALWLLKLAAIGSALGVLALVWKCAERLARPALPAVLAVGLNPAFLVYGVGGAHNDFLMMLLLLGGLYLILSERYRLGGAALAVAVAVKAAAVPIAPFALLASRRRGRTVAAALVALACLGALTLAVFGPHVLGFSQQAATVDQYSLPRVLAAPFGAGTTTSCAERLTGCEPRALQLIPAMLLALALAFLMYRVWRGADAIDSAGWAALAVIASLASVMAWYLVWALPLTALSRSRRLYAATAAIGIFLLLTTWPARKLLLP